MTPERQKWWNSLPAEEKRVRMDIELCKKQIKWQKRNLRWVVLTGDECKMIINHNKRVIKDLRKQIAMDVIALHNSAYEYYTCPYCGQNVREGTGMRDEDRYCASCGQKLRWE